MGPVGYRLRAEARLRWRAWLGLALIAGLAAGAIVALAAGARRTDSAYSRYLDAQNAADVLVVNEDEDGDPIPVDELDAVADRPEVVESAPVGYGLISGNSPMTAIVPLDDRFGRELNRLDLEEGRLPEPDSPEEVVVSLTAAEIGGIEVGDTMTLTPPVIMASAGDPSVVATLPPEDQVVISQAQNLEPENTLRVVGLVTAPGTFPPQQSVPCCVYHSASFAEPGVPLEARALRLEDGVSGQEFQEALADDGEDLSESVARLDGDVADVERAIHVQAVGLWLLAALGALVAGLVVGQLLTRSAFIEAADSSVLASIGMARGDRLWLGLARAAAVGTVAALTATVVALLLSPLFPTGLARIAEPDLGLSIDPTALGLGAVATVLATVAISIIPAWRASRADRPTEGGWSPRPGRLVALLTRAGAPLPTLAGTRMATTRGGRGAAVPIWSSLGAIAVGIAALVGGLTFGAGLRHLLETPSLYGVGWDVEMPLAEPGLAERLADDLQGVSAIEGLAVGTTEIRAEVEEGDASLALVGLDPVEGDVMPATLEGRLPDEPDEIALDGEAMDHLDLSLGDAISLRLADDDADATSLTVVGRTVLPNTSLGAGVRESGLVTIDGLADVGLPGDTPLGLFLNASDDVDPDELVAAIAEGPCAAETFVGECPVISPVRYPPPSDVANFGRAASVPRAMGGVFAVLAAATLAHVVITSVRRRRRELALFRTLGFTRGQLVLTVTSAATTAAVIGLIVGIPVGVAAGRWLWTVRAEDLAVAVVPRVPLLALLIVAVGALVLANLIALLPARAAARTPAAEVLRAE